MIARETFIKTYSALQNFWCKIYPEMDKLGLIHEGSPILKAFDNITDALAEEVDPGESISSWFGIESPLIYKYLFEEPFAKTPAEVWADICNRAKKYDIEQEKELL